jgi:hypothetical protein
MKNIIILTTYEDDTLEAMKVANDLKRSSAGTIVLISLSETTDSITDLLFLSEKNQKDAAKRARMFVKWSHIERDQKIKPMSVQEHVQYGISRPVLIQLLERFNTEMIIVPNSVQQSKSFIHLLFLKLLNKSEFPIMRLPAEKGSSEEIQRALYLDETGKALAPALQNMPFHIIHQSMVDREQSLGNLITKLKINLIVQTRVHESVFKEDVVSLGLPVLTV